MKISSSDKKMLLNSILLPNIKFMEAVIHILTVYGETLSETDIEILTDREKSRKLLKQDYPVLLEVDPTKNKIEQIHISGNYRYYANKKCVVKGKEYFYTSQLYGYGEATSHGDNRTPLWKWICEKFDVQPESQNNDWWPSQEQYSLNLTKEDWKKYILEEELPNHPSPMKMLKGMMELGGEVSCKQLSETYGGHPSVYAGCAMNLGRRVKKYFNLPPCMDGEQERYFPLPFVGKYRGGSEDNYLYRIRTELYEALNEIDLSGIDPNYKGGEKQLSTKEILQQINTYIAVKGFTFDEGLVENFYLSLKSKPFVILAGTSGTGKTRLVRMFAEAIGAYDDKRYLQVAVKPDWSDSTDLFGHVNLDNEFVKGTIIEFIHRAANDKNNLPYILCLDEMNLARVEYYLSDFLSVIETRDWDGDNIKTDPLVPTVCYSGNIDAEKAYSKLILPENLYIVGTVNMDETTFPFSKKVLDRANTIEFSYVDFALPEVVENNEADIIPVENSFLRADYLRLTKDCAEQWETVIKINKKLADLNEILKSGDLHFGYRMRDEIIFYMLYREKADLLSENEAFDNQIMQKILPRIQGSSESIAYILRELFKECAGPFANKNGSSDSKKMENYMKGGAGVKYPRSAEKIWKMLRRFEDDDFTSYWV